MSGAAARVTGRGCRGGHLAARWRDYRLRLRALQRRLGECRRELREALARVTPDPIEVGELALEERLLLERERELLARRTLARGHGLRAGRSPRAADVSAAA